jgi:hypothetical protein
MSRRHGRPARRPARPDAAAQLALFDSTPRTAAAALADANALQAADAVRVVALHGEAERLFVTLSGAIAVLHELLAPDAVSFPADLVAARVLGTSDIADGCRTAASALIAHAVAASDLAGQMSAPASVPLETARSSLSRATTAQVVEAGLTLPEIERRLDEAVYGCVAELLRELAIEQYGLMLHLAFDPDNAATLLGLEPTSPAAADVYLISRVFDRLEVSLLGQPLLLVEREASGWEFARWSSQARRLSQLEFCRGVREQEWSLLDRPSLFLGESVAAAFGRQGVSPDLPLRQLRLAEAMTRSFPGVFRVRERGGLDMALFEDLVSRRQFVVHEHSSETEYRPGSIGLGRLFPLEDGWLRSQGMLFASFGEDEEALTLLVEGLAAGESDARSRMVMLEGFISQVLGGARVPRRVPVAANPLEARERLESVTELLIAEGFSTTAPTGSDSSPASAAAANGPHDAQRIEYLVDEVVGDWLRALIRHSQGDPGWQSRRRAGRSRRSRRMH